jgi:hypothetical protein
MQLQHIPILAHMLRPHLLPVELHALAPDLSELEIFGDLTVQLIMNGVRPFLRSVLSVG